MRFPLALTARIAGYIIGKKIRRVEKFATVLQLEPLHTCNLTCTGCGRIREYSTSLKDVMSLEDCLAAAKECEAPMVSICGGEPLIYPHIEDLVSGLLAQKRIVYICTNGMFMRKKMRDYLEFRISDCRSRNDAKAMRGLDSKIDILISEELLTAEQAANLRNPKSAIRNPISPSRWMYWNVHLDGLERTHDLIVEREGVFKECIAAIRMAKILGYQVATNTTVYKETEMAELEQMFDYLSWLGVDGHTISPGYDYDAAKQDMMERLNLQPENFFLTREMTKEKFKNIRVWGEKYTLFGTPIYLGFSRGQTRTHLFRVGNPDSQCERLEGALLFDDGCPPRHLQRLARKNPMGKIRRYKWEMPATPAAKIAWCIAATNQPPLSDEYGKPGDTWANISFNFGKKPATRIEGAEVNAFNGVSIGRGHKTGRPEKITSASTRA